MKITCAYVKKGKHNIKWLCNYLASLCMHIYSSLWNFALNYRQVQKTLWAMKKCGMGGSGSASYTRGVLINFLWNFSHILNDALLFLLDNEIRHGFEIQFLLWEKTGQQLLLNNGARYFILSWCTGTPCLVQFQLVRSLV